VDVLAAAIWWAIGQLQLSREQTVDALVVARSGARQAYMAALLVFADRWSRATPAIPYIRRRHLASRLKQLAQEKIMSRTRLTLAAAALIGILAASGLVIVSALPLQASQNGQRLRPSSADPITITFKNASLTNILSFVGMTSGITITYEKGFVDVPVASVDVQKRNHRADADSDPQSAPSVLPRRQRPYEPGPARKVEAERRQ